MDMTEQDLAIGAEDLVTLLHGLASDELILLYVELNKVLLEATYTTQLDVFQLMFTSIELDELDTLEVVVEVDNVLRESARICLLECGIHYQEDVSLPTLIELTRAILLFDTTEEPQTLIDIIDVAEDDHECLLTLLAHLTGIDDGEWITVISGVNEGVIDRIRDVAKEVLTIDYQVDDIDYSLSDRLSKLKNVVADNTTQTQLVESLESLASPPPFETLYMMHLNSMVEASMEDVVSSIYSLACVAHPRGDESFEAAVGGLNDFYEDPLERQQAGQLLYNLKGNYSKVYQET